MGDRADGTTCCAICNGGRIRRCYRYRDRSLSAPGDGSSRETALPVAPSVTAAYVTDVATRFACPICDRETVPTAKRPAVRCQLTFRDSTRKRARWWRTHGPVCSDCVESGRNRFVIPRITSASGLVQADTLPSGDLDRGRCEVCGIHVAMPHDANRKHFVCGDSCRQKLYKPPVEKTVTACAGCGSEFTARRGARYCSSACRQRAYRDASAKRGPR